MKEINCKCGKIIQFDDENLEDFQGRNWSCADGRVAESGYVSGIKVRTSMASCVIVIPDGLFPDHIDRNYHNNQKSNLRVATREENNRNRRPSRNGTSIYKGVSKHKKQKHRKWVARIQTNGVETLIGSFYTEEEAARVYDQAAKIQHGTFAYLNFPNE